MAEFKVRTKGGAIPQGKPRVYFTCHFSDFSLYFDKICEDIFRTQDCAIYYTEDMNEPLDETNITVDLGRINLFVVPVTARLMGEPCRTMQVDLAFAKENNIPILPFMMESGIDEMYSRVENFGTRQYLSPFSTDATAIGYEEKLKKHLESVLISDEMARRVRAAFDAYVFLSYRKKDRRHAGELMRIIHNIPGCRDIAIWYDEFLTPGESFIDNIEKAMRQSRLFTLLVTPSILEDGNFVMAEEYPAARRGGMDILPAEMEMTDRRALADKFEGVPEPVSTDDDIFSATLLKTIEGIAHRANDGEPEHNFLIGLAYLDGIDVEVNADRGRELITMAAEAELPEAMIKLYRMHLDGIRVPQDFFKAKYWAERLMKYYQRTEGDEGANTLVWLYAVGIVQYSLEYYDKAYEALERAHRLMHKAYGERHPDTLNALSRLAQTNFHLGRVLKALEQMESVFFIRHTDLGPEHPDTLAALNLLGYFHTVRKGESREDAFKYTKQAYELRLKLLGEEHLDTIISKNNLANAYHIFGNSKRAIEIQTEVCATAEKVLGFGSASTLLYFSNLGIFYQKQMRYRKSAEILERACDGWREYGMENHPHSLLAMYNLVVAYFALFKIKKAYDLSERLYALQLQVFGREHPDTAVYRKQLQMICIMCWKLKRWFELEDES